jgi:hypothetical protein
VNAEESFDNSTYADQMHAEESELAAFVNSVKELFGSEQARLAVRDWLDESELMDSPPRAISRDWRAVTIAASARLAERLVVAPHYGILSGTLPGTLRAASPDTNVSPIPSSNCAATILLV